MARLYVFFAVFGIMATAWTQTEPTVTVLPEEIDTAFRNPGMGWVIYNFKPVTDPGSGNTTIWASIAYTNYFAWRDLEPTEGEYRWDLIDNFINYWSAPGRNKKVAIAFHLTDPTSLAGGVHVPDWVFGDPRMTGRWYSTFYGRSNASHSNPEYEPDYWNPFFLDKLGNFLMAMGQQYRNSELWQRNIEWIDISTYGYWGEWHSEITWPDHATKVQTLRTMIDQYADAFPRSQSPTPSFSMNAHNAGGSFDDLGVTYAVEELGAMTVRRGIGWPEAVPPAHHQFVLDHIPTNPFFGEWGSSTGSIFDGDFPTGLTTEEAVKHGLSFKPCYLGWYVSDQWYGPGRGPLSQIESTTGETLGVYFQKRCGYRLVLAEATYPSSVPAGWPFYLDQVWQQKGVAKMYKQYPLRAYLEGGGHSYALEADTTFDATQWMQGGPYEATSRFTVPASAPRGFYTLKIALVDPVYGEPAVNLAIAGKDESDPNRYGKYTLGNIAVTRSTEPPVVETRSLAETVALSSTQRNDFANWAGMKITVGDRPLRIKQLGRYFLAGNKRAHELQVVRVNDAVTVAYGTVLMNTNAPDALGFEYTPASGILEANAEYYILSKEEAGGDTWLSYNNVITPSEDITVNGCVWSADLSDFSVGLSPGLSYVPVNVLYDVILLEGESDNGEPVPTANVMGELTIILSIMLFVFGRTIVKKKKLLTFQETEILNR